MEKQFLAVRIKFTRILTLTISYSLSNWSGMETKFTAVEISLGLNSTWFLFFCRLKFARVERRPTVAKRGSNVSCEVHDSRPKRADGLSPYLAPARWGRKTSPGRGWGRNDSNTRGTKQCRT